MSTGELAWAEGMRPRVVIEQTGRGGSIRYVEGNHVAHFSWEFAMTPVLALIFGGNSTFWDSELPWAAGRQQEVYRAVAKAVLLEKAPGCRARLDLVQGVIEIVQRGEEDGTGEDAGVLEFTETPMRIASDPRPRAPVDPREALHDHLSVDVRLAAAETILAGDDTFPLEPFLAHQIRALHSERDGLERALRLAAARPGPEVLQALLYASWNQTECSQACARLLLQLRGAEPDADDAGAASMLDGLAFHRNYYTRKAAFDELCRRTGMTLLV